MVIHLLINGVPRRPYRVLDRQRIGAAVGDNRHAIQSDQRRAAVLRIVETTVRLLQRFAAHQIAEPAGYIFFEGAFQNFTGKARNAFHRLQRDVTGKAVTNHHVDFTIENYGSFDIADIIDRRGRYLFARRPRQFIAFAVLLAITQHTDAWIGHAENSLGIDRTHQAKLNQVMRLAIDIGAGVDNHRAFFKTRNND